MRRYLLDTNAVSDFINDRRGVRAKARAAKRAGGRIGTCYPALGELCYGAELSATRAVNLRLIDAGVRQLKLWPFDRAAAAEFGRLRADLKRRGRPMQIIDIQIAAIALTLANCIVVSADTDFLAVPGLSVENWAA